MENNYQEDLHSCTINSEYDEDGPGGPGRYCTVCGRMTKSSEAMDEEADRWNYERQNGDFETF